MQGDVVIAADGSRVTLGPIGTSVALDTEEVRVWDVVLPPGGVHPWHLHHNPYVVLSIAGSTGYMDWLDGSPQRQIIEYPGGSVFRPVSSVHRLTNTGGHYRNRLVELKALGESNPDGVVDVGPGARSIEGESAGDPLPDGRVPVLGTDYVRVWTLTLAPGASATLDLTNVPHVIAEIDARLEGEDIPRSVRQTAPGDRVDISNDGDHERRWFVVSLDYLEQEEAQ